MKTKAQVAKDKLAFLIRVLYDRTGVEWGAPEQRAMETLIDAVVTQAVEEARNERKGLANPRRTYTDV